MLEMNETNNIYTDKHEYADYLSCTMLVVKKITITETCKNIYVFEQNDHKKI